MAGETPVPVEVHVENFMDSQTDQAAREAIKVPGLRLDITALTGGLSTSLDNIATVGLDPANGVCLILGVSIGVTVPHQIWVLEAGTNVEDPANGIVRPDDYAAGTNEKIWKALSAL